MLGETSVSSSTCFLDLGEDSTDFSKWVESNLKCNPRSGRNARCRTKGSESDPREDGEGFANNRKPANDVNNEDGNTLGYAATIFEPRGASSEDLEMAKARNSAGVDEVIGRSSESVEPGKRTARGGRKPRWAIASEKQNGSGCGRHGDKEWGRFRSDPTRA